MTVSNRMTGFERRVAISIAGIFSTRMLGLFMILPVFSDYAKELDGYSLFLAGIALGIYGLTQAMFQIPLGWLSDRIGRKPVIIGGLLVFALGSVVAAMSTTLMGVIIGRALQGAGAIASAVMALAADLTLEEHRMKVMAMIGISIGMSFAVALVAGPILHGWFGMSGIFWTTALLALGGIILVLVKIPTPAVSRFHRDTEVEKDWLRNALMEPQLLRLDFSILILHFILMSSFVVIPIILSQKLGLNIDSHWKLYLPILFLSILAITPFILLAEKKRKIKQVFTSAVAIIFLAELAMVEASQSLTTIVVVLWLFFCAFNLLEALLPSLVSKVAPAAHKGTAMGAYSTAQFLGVFLGGLLGGWCATHWGLENVFLMNSGLALLWLLLIWRMPQPTYSSSYLLNVGVMDNSQAIEMTGKLSVVNGVIESQVIGSEGIAYLKVNMSKLDLDTLYSYSVSDDSENINK